MGITSLLIAEADAARVRAGKPRAVKAIWADVPMSDAYRDVTFHGGAVDAGFIPLWLGLTSRPVGRSRRRRRPATRRARRPTWADHLAQRASTSPRRRSWHHARPGRRLRRPVLPAALARRPRRADQRPGRHHRRLVGHLPARRAAAVRAADATRRSRSCSCRRTTTRPAARRCEDPDLKDKWFDRWLKGADNGVENTPNVNLYPIGGDQLAAPHDVAGAGRRLHALLPRRRRARSATSQAAPRAAGDTAPLLPASSPCSRMTTQWTAGAAPGPVRDRQPHLGGDGADLHDAAAGARTRSSPARSWPTCGPS